MIKIALTTLITILTPVTGYETSLYNPPVGLLNQYLNPSRELYTDFVKSNFIYDLVALGESRILHENSMYNSKSSNDRNYFTPSPYKKPGTPQVAGVSDHKEIQSEPVSEYAEPARAVIEETNIYYEVAANDLESRLSDLESKLVDQEFLASLKGEKGDTGLAGPAGAKGDTGERGAQGYSGSSGGISLPVMAPSSTAKDGAGTAFQARYMSAGDFAVSDTATIENLTVTNITIGGTERTTWPASSSSSGSGAWESYSSFSNTITPTTTNANIYVAGSATTTGSFYVGADDLVVLDGGNVGIGTTTPAYQLSVAGQSVFTPATGTSPVIIINDATGGAAIELRTGYDSSDSIYIGQNSGSSVQSEAVKNTALGSDAMQSNTTGSYNTAIGQGTLTDNTTGDANVAVGQQSLSANTTGQLNTAVGVSALRVNTEGESNTVVGYNSLRANTEGDYNLAAGTYALRFNTTGSYNTALGPYYTLGRNTTGDYNTALGYYALNFNGTGNNNTVLGSEAGYGVSGLSDVSNNIILGYKSGHTILTGADNNILLGYQAADSLTTGSNNIVIGYDVEAPSNSASNQLNIGNLIFATGVDGTGTTLSSGNVGIGTASPTALLSVNSSGSNASINNPTSGQGVILSAAGGSTTGQLRIIANDSAWADNASTAYFQIRTLANNNATFMGGTYGADAPLDRLQFNSEYTTITNNAYTDTPVATAIFEVVNDTAARNVMQLVGAGSQTGDFMQITSNGGAAGNIMTVDSSGNVGIGTTDPSRKLHIHEASGNAYLQLTQASTGTGVNDGFQISMGASQVNFINRESGNIVFETNGNELVRFKSTGNVGIGTTTPWALLAVNAPAGQNSFVIGSSTATSLIVNENGNVGINTLSPTSIFYVTPNSAQPTGYVKIGTSGANLGAYMDIVHGPSESAYIFEVGKSSSGQTASFAATDIILRQPTDIDVSTSNVALTIDQGSSGPILRVIGPSSSDKMWIANDGNVGIGTTAPGHKLTVVGDGDSNSGIFAIDVTGSGLFKWASASIAPSLSAGNNIIHIIGQAESTKNSGYIGFNYQSAGSDNNYLTFGLFGADNLLNLNGAGNLGIGTTNPGMPLEVYSTGVVFRLSDDATDYVDIQVATDGDFLIIPNSATQGSNQVQYDGDSNWDFSSDERIKKDIEDAEPFLDKVMDLKVRRFNYIQGDIRDYKEIGLIAQEVQPLFPEIVGSSTHPLIEGEALTLGYTTFGVISLKAVQELKNEKDVEIAALTEKMDDWLYEMNLGMGLNPESTSIINNNDQEIEVIDAPIEDIELKVTDNIIYEGEIQVEKEISFNSDTAGGAIIKAYDDHVDVVFADEYKNTPIIVISLLAEVNLDRYYIDNISTKGFTINLSPVHGNIDIGFNWLALAVKDPVIYVSNGTIEPYELEVVDYGAYYDYRANITAENSVSESSQSANTSQNSQKSEVEEVENTTPEEESGDTVEVLGDSTATDEEESAEDDSSEETTDNQDEENTTESDSIEPIVEEIEPQDEPIEENIEENDSTEAAEEETKENTDQNEETADLIEETDETEPIEEVVEQEEEIEEQDIEPAEEEEIEETTE
jgi:hypothetical protein